MTLLIIGHAGHGKDTVATALSHRTGITWGGSSDYMAHHYIWPEWGHEHYDTVEDCYADRANHRDRWHDMILEFNTPDRTRLARGILSVADCYVGMRAIEEFEACRDAKLFDHVLWVERDGVPPEPDTSFTIPREVADTVITSTKADDGDPKALFVLLDTVSGWARDYLK